MKYNIDIQPANMSYQSADNLLNDAISENIALEHSCKNGACGACKAEVISGSIINENGHIVSSGTILTCQSKALSDATLRVNIYPQLANIQEQTLPCKVVSVRYATQDIIVLKFRFPPSAKFKFLAGQYVDLIFGGVKRSYSIANINSDALELHIRRVENGEMSGLIFDMVKENQLFRIEGPKGTFFIREGVRPLVLIATGTGIAPIKAMVEQLVKNKDPRSIYIYWGMKYQEELYCQELETMTTNCDDIHFLPVLSQHIEPLQQCYVQQAVVRDFPSLADKEVYACGSPEMINQARDLFLEHELPLEFFHFDAFTPAKLN